MALEKEKIITAFYEEARTYDLHFSNIRTTLATFCLTLGFGAAGFLYDKYRLSLPYSLELQSQLRYVPLIFFVIAFLLSGNFNRLTRACHSFQHTLEDLLTKDLNKDATGNLVINDGTRVTLFREHLRGYLALRCKYDEKQPQKKRGECIGRLLKAFIGDLGQLVLLAVILGYALAISWQVKQWSKAQNISKPLAIEVMPKAGLKNAPPALIINWLGLKDEEGIVYRATVTDEHGVALCQTELMLTTSYVCKELRRAGGGQSIPMGEIESTFVKVEAYKPALVLASMRPVIMKNKSNGNPAASQGQTTKVTPP